MACPRSTRPLRRRALLAGLALAPSMALCAAPLAPASGSGPVDGGVDVWVQLTLPELARVPAAQRASARSGIARQQDDVMAQLRALGAVEQVRVQWVRNAVAVRLPAAALAQARTLDGVRAVTPVRHRELHRP